jgi:ribosomal protein S18 acetylase RimI-like enzyme
MVVFAAMQGERLVGTVSLDCALPPNQPHRGDVCKMMVHPDYRRCGIAHQMMVAVEDEARARGFSLLVLDTRSGDAAQSLYAACGFVAVGEIPGYALDPDGRATHGTTVMYRTLSPA